MKKIINILWLITMMLVFSGYFSTTEAISIIPSVVKLSILPGEDKSGTFEIHNAGKKDVYVEIAMKDWILEGNSRKFAEQGTHSRSLCSWITFEEESFTIAPQQKRIIRYMIEVPKNTQGGYWGLVGFKSQPLKRSAGIKVTTQIISFIGIEVEGTLKRKVKITEISGEYIEDKGVRLKAKLKNLGNVQIFQPSPEGKFKIEDKDNNIIAEGKLEGLMILPDEIGEYVSEYFKLDKGEYETIITFDYGEPKLIGTKVMLSTNTFYDWKILEKVESKK